MGDFNIRQITADLGWFLQMPLLSNHLDKVKLIHDKDLSDGFGTIYPPHALAKTKANARVIAPYGLVNRRII